jgi:hypothetical protein
VERGDSGREGERLGGAEEGVSLVMNPTSIWSIDYLMGTWKPGFHDDHFIGWLLTGSYLACALLAWFIAAFHKHLEERLAAKFWNAISLLMVLLGINKQLALQMLLTEMGRQVAKAQGWYDQRRIVQFTFIVVFAATFTAAFIWFAKKYRGSFARYRLVFCGLFFLLCFVIIRAAAFHHFDEVIQYDLHGFKMNWLLELTGIYVIILAEVKEIVVSTIRSH